MSTSFFAHPIVTNATVRAAEPCSRAMFLPVVDVLERLAVILALQERDDLLKGVARRRAHAQAVTFDFNHPMAGKALNFEIELLEAK